MNQENKTNNKHTFFNERERYKYNAIIETNEFEYVNLKRNDVKKLVLFYEKTVFVVNGNGKRRRTNGFNQICLLLIMFATEITSIYMDGILRTNMKNVHLQKFIRKDITFYYR